MPKWNSNETSILQEHFNKSSQEMLEQLLNRKFNTIKSKAYKLKLIRNRNPVKLRKNNISKLLLNTPEAFYWIGFLLADGCFKKYVITITSSVTDKEHLLKLKGFVEKESYQILKGKTRNFKGKTYLCQDQVQLICSNCIDVPKIKDKFGITYCTKTENPPTKLHLICSDDLLFSLIIGFIDGDGSIANDRIAVEVYHTWLSILQLFDNLITKIFHINRRTYPRINTRNYAFWDISRMELLQQIKLKAIALQLPLMERKWCKIL